MNTTKPCEQVLTCPHKTCSVSFRFLKPDFIENFQIVVLDFFLKKCATLKNSKTFHADKMILNPVLLFFFLRSKNFGKNTVNIFGKFTIEIKVILLLNLMIDNIFMYKLQNIFNKKIKNVNIYNEYLSKTKKTLTLF